MYWGLCYVRKELLELYSIRIELTMEWYGFIKQQKSWYYKFLGFYN